MAKLIRLCVGQSKTVQINSATTFRSPSQNRPLAAVDVSATLLLRLQKSELFLDYQKAFEGTTGLPLSLKETGSFHTPLQGSKRVNKFCALMIGKSKSCAACLQLQQRLVEEATREPRTLQCHAGLNESAVPVRVGNTVLGYLQTGQVFFRMPSENSFKSIMAVAEAVTAARAREMKTAYFQTRVVSRKQYESVISLLVIFAEHLATVSGSILMTEEAAEPLGITRGRLLIAEHHSEELSLSDVARAARMSVCYFSRIFKKATGLTFTEYLARERIQSVKRLLLNANMRVSEAAYAAGFQSLSQFNRVFRRVGGESPSTYRERLHGIDHQPGGGAGLVTAA